MFPSLFISHGAPSLALMDNAVSRSIKDAGAYLQGAKSIIIISAHWQSSELRILAKDDLGLIYDFSGFEKELYEISFPIRNDLNLVEKVCTVLEDKGFEVKKEYERSGYDHGVWVPLYLMQEALHVPVVQLSLPSNSKPEYLMQLGAALCEFKNESLIIGSGNLTHNLYDLVWDIDSEVKEYAKAFRDWVVQKLKIGDEKALIDFMAQAPYALKNHPTVEHFLPLFVAMGASNDKKGKSLIEAYMYGNQAMDLVIFEN